MKKAVLFLAVSVLMLMISCGDDQPTKTNTDDIISITWRVEQPMSTEPYITVLINQNEIKCYQKIHTDTVALVDKNDSISLSESDWNEIRSSFDLEDFLNLDSEYLMKDSLIIDYPSNFLDVVTTTQSKTVKYEKFDYADLSVIKRLDSIIRYKYQLFFAP